MKRNIILKAATGIAALIVSQSTLAAKVEHTYNFDGKPISATEGAPNVSVSAWYGTSDSDDVLDEAHSWNIYSGGAGIYNEGYRDQHTIDNMTHWNRERECVSRRWNGSCRQYKTNWTESDAVYDYLALSFDQLVSLAHVNIGYVSGDSDFSVFYSDNPNYDFDADANDNAISLTDGGFKLATHVNGGAAALHDISADTHDIQSSLWIVAAYSPVLGDSTNQHIDKGDDKFKLSAVSVHTKKGGNGGGEVPVPATAALLGLGLLLRRRTSLAN